MRIAKSALAALVVSSGGSVAFVGSFSPAATFSPRPSSASASASASASSVLPATSSVFPPRATASSSSALSSEAAAADDVATKTTDFAARNAGADLDVPSLTSAFLDMKSNPPGSLLPSRMDDALPLCLHWARASASAGAAAAAAAAANDRRGGGGKAKSAKGGGAEDNEWGMHPAEIVEKIVERLETERAEGSEKVLPWRNLYAVSIDAWAKSGRPDAADRARAVLDSLIPPAQQQREESDDGDDDDVNDAGDDNEDGGEEDGAPPKVAAKKTTRNPWASPNTVMHNAVLNAYAKSSAMGDRDAAKRAEGLLRNMEKIYEKSRRQGEDGTAAAATSAAASAEEADVDVEEGDDEYDEDDEYEAEAPNDRAVVPNTISYTSVIDAYAQSSRPNAASDAERIFRRMERARSETGNDMAAPNARSFNAVLHAWAKTGTGRGAMRAEEILRRMVELGNEEEEDGGEEGVTPTVVSFTTVMNGWAKSNESGAADRALGVYRLMSDLRESGKSNARPNAFTYSALIDSLCRAGRVEEATELWEDMARDFEGDAVAANGRKEGSTIPPNAIQLTHIVSTLSKSGDPQAGTKADALLSRLESLHSAHPGLDQLRPNVRTYTAVITAHAKSRSFGKARAARAVLERLKGAYETSKAEDVRPNVAAYTSFLNACAFAVGDGPEKRDALLLAASAYQEMCHDTGGYGPSVRPNQYAYGTMLRVCSNLIPQGKERTKSMTSVFKRCREEGYVDETVMRAMRGGLSREELREALGGSDGAAAAANTGEVPKEWRRNVSKGGAGFRGSKQRSQQRGGGGNRSRQAR